MATRIISVIVFLTGAGLIFIGARFLLSPETAERGYGIQFQEMGDYSFHYIKGIRDLFTGLLICLLLITKQRRALSFCLLLGTMIPAVDMAIVLSHPYNGLAQATPHITAVIICSLSGLFFLFRKEENKKTNFANGYAKILSSAVNGNHSIIEFNTVPGEKTPVHFHTLFSETFEVLKGNLEVGRNKDVMQFKPGDKVTVEPNERHYFNNISGADCLIKVTVKPGNINFEKALLIEKGLAKDGLATESVTPKRLSDLALFIYLNNSKMSGFAKIAEPFFHYLAMRAIRRGRLKQLLKKYAGE